MKTSNGYIFELQFHTSQSLKIKEKNHKLYEEARLSSTKLERKEELKVIMKNNTKKVPIPMKVEEIKDVIFK